MTTKSFIANNRTKAIARTAGSATLALAAVAAIAGAAGQHSDAVEPTTLASTIAASNAPQ
ncbi:hypothetical protein ACWDSJ_32840 [Nocardia sp. NPDC003482]